MTATPTSKIEIPRIPTLPPEVIRAIENETLIIFLGAGVSRLIGCKGWDELARNLINKCYELRCITFREKETLELERDHKKNITMCYNLLVNEGYEKDFYTAFDEALLPVRKYTNDDNIYKQLITIDAAFITTNADLYFTEFFRPERIYTDENQFEISNMEIRKLFLIHGIQTNRDSLIFTVDKYIEKYNVPMFRDFLTKIFSDKWTILFMGYGLSEFELLDYVVTKSTGEKVKTKKVVAPRHFVLLPYYKEEGNLKNIHQLYYNHLGIKILPFQKDKNGYQQLYHVIKAWNEQQIRKTNNIPKNFDQIDAFVNSL